MAFFVQLTSKRVLLPVLACVIFSMLYIGLRDDIPERNQVLVSSEDGALVFGERALAYSRNYLDKQKIDALNAHGFTVKLNFKPLRYDNRNFQFLLLLSNGNSADQFLIAQFGEHIIVMNGDDYNYRRKLPRLSLRLDTQAQTYQQLTLTVGKDFTHLTLKDGNKVTRKGRLVSLPPVKQGLRLLLSGSELLENNWRGAMQSISIANSESKLSLIDFHGAENIDEQARLTQWLLIPTKLSLLKHRVLEATTFKINSSSVLMDIVLNFFGFIPCGFLIAALLCKIPMSFHQPIFRGLLVVFITFLCAFLLSFIIEYRQAWLVTRHSSLRDLALNALGGTMGAACWLVAEKLRLMWLGSKSVHSQSKRYKVG